MAGSIGTDARGLTGFPNAGGAPLTPGPVASHQEPDQQRTERINAQLGIARSVPQGPDFTIPPRQGSR